MEASNLRRVSALAVFVASLMLLVTLAGSAAAQSDPVVVVKGSDTAQNYNETGDEPMINYPVGSNPPIIMAQEIGDGAVVAGGFASTLRYGEAYSDQRWRDNEFEFYMDSVFQWLTDKKAPSDTTVLWYEGYNVYNTTEMCTYLIENLRAMGYTIKGGVTKPFADVNLSSYDVVLIPQLQLGDGGTGGDPSMLPSSDVEALKSYVEGGGGLIVTDQSDYGGNHYSDVHNKILAGIGAGFSFQDDDLNDPGRDATGSGSNWQGEDYQPVGIVTDNAFGGSFQSATGSSDLGFYSVCTMKFGTGPALSAEITPPAATGYVGGTKTLKGLVTYKGSGEKTVSLEIEDNYGWVQSISKDQVTLATNESENFTIQVKVPGDISKKKLDWIKVTASGQDTEVSAKARLVSAIPKDKPPYPKKEGYQKYYWFSTATLLVKDPAVPVMTGMETGFSTDQKQRAPWPLLYAENEYAPCMAAAMIGDGRVLVNGGGGSIRSSPSDWYTPLGSQVAPRLARWMVNWEDPREHTWMYYTPVSEEGPGFMSASSMSGFLTKLENDFGFNVVRENGNTSNITSDMLSDVDVFQITGDSVLSFTDSAVNNLISWVNNGGSLFISSQSDYGGYSNVSEFNKLLSEMGAGITVQDDQLTDPDHFTQDGSHFPGVYLLDAREANSNFDMWWPAHSIETSVPESVVRGKSGTQQTFTVKITNTGSTDTTVGIGVSQTTDKAAWNGKVTPASSEVNVASGESKEVTINVQIPEVTELTRTEWIVTGTDLDQDFIKSSAPFRVLGEAAGGGGGTGGGEEEGGLPWMIIGGAVVVIVVIVIAGIVVMRR